MTQYLNAALQLAQAGHRVAWVAPGAKEPPMREFPTKASCDEKTLREWWSANGNRNVAIVPNSDQVVIDLDVKKNGPANWAALIAKNSTPQTRTTITPTKGQHKFFGGMPFPAANAVDAFASELVAAGVDLPHGAKGKPITGIDVRGPQGYLLGPGSTVRAGTYRFERMATGSDELAPIAPVPAWIVDALSPARTKINASNASVPDADPSTVERAREWLAKQPPAVEGQGGDLQTFTICAGLRDLAVSEAQAVVLLASEWNSRCSPPWGFADLRAKAANAFRYAAGVPGARTATANDFEAITGATVDAKGSAPEGAEDDAEGDKVRDAALYKLNERYFMVLLGGKAYIARERVPGEKLSETDSLIEYQAAEDFRAWHKGHTIASLDGKKQIEIAEEWLRWSRRRRYERVMFLPGQVAKPSVYNLWRGFAVEPKAGDWSKFKGHIENVVCAGDAERTAYVLDWLAHAVQHPGRPGEVAIVLKGGRGIGKGAFARGVGRLFGPHFYHASRSSHIVGEFNAHLEHTALLFADEAFFAGDRQHEAELKRLITEPTLSVNQKFLPLRLVPNNLHVIMASNEDWVIPAGLDERRFMMLEVSSTKCGDRAYFGALESELHAGGLAAMLDELLKRDVTKFEPGSVPVSAALMNQKTQSLAGVDGWLLECLHAREVAGNEWPVEDNLEVPKSMAWMSFDSWQERRRYDRRIAQSVFWRKLRERFGDRTIRPRDQGALAERRFSFPGLSSSRQVMEKVLRGPVEWNEPIRLNEVDLL